MGLRIRQIVLAARDLAAAVQEVKDTLGLDVMYRDPEVAKFGLTNAIMAIGDQFLEIVSPTREDTAASRHLDRMGESAYMLILQTDDLDRDRERLALRGVRIVWESNHPDMRAIHLHPKDIGAAIVSLDEATPPASWRWAGPNWLPSRSTADRIVDATIAARDPAALAMHWSQILGLAPPQKVDGKWRLGLDEGTLNFVSTGDGMERIIEFGLRSSGRSGGSVGGTRFVSR